MLLRPPLFSCLTHAVCPTYIHTHANDKMAQTESRHHSGMSCVRVRVCVCGYSEVRKEWSEGIFAVWLFGRPHVCVLLKRREHSMVYIQINSLEMDYLNGCTGTRLEIVIKRNTGKIKDVARESPYLSFIRLVKERKIKTSTCQRW